MNEWKNWKGFLQMRLAEITLEDLDDLVKWHQDPVVRKFTNTEGKNNKQEITEWFLADYPRFQEKVYMIKVKNKNVGYITENEGEIGIVIDQESRRQGIGKKAILKF